MVLTTNIRGDILLTITCSVCVMVALQPGLHTNQIMLIHEEYDVLGPENLIY